MPDQVDGRATEIGRTGSPPTRRDFLAISGAVLAAFDFSVVSLLGCGRRSPPGPHPEPRPDVNASRVVPAADLPDDLVPLFDGIREIPHIADGVRCRCGCADVEGFRSLLSCFESGGMAVNCKPCQSEGRMVVRLHRRRRTLDQIRRAVDARFG